MKKLIIKYPLLIIVSLATLLRLPLLGGSFWMDEAAQALEIIRPLNQQLNIVADFQPPLLHLILHFAQYFSKAEWYLRTIGALIPGLVTIIYSYKIAEKLFSKKVALISGLLLATSSFHIYFSQELRPYSLPTAFALVSMFHFIHILENKSKINFFGNRSDDNLVFLTIFNALGLYSSYLYPFFMLAQIAYAVTKFKFKKVKSILLSFTFSILAFFPFLPIFLRQLQEGNNVRKQLPGWDQVVSIPQLKALPMVFGKLIFGTLPLDINIFVIIFSLTLGIIGLLVAYKSFNNIKKLKLTLLLFWLIVPLLSAWLVSFVVPVVRPKRLLFLLPALYILLTHLSLQLKIKKPYYKNLGAIFLGTLFFINIFSTVNYYITPKQQREDWKSLNTQLHKNFRPEETLLIYSFPDEFAPMQWYELQQVQAFDKYSTKVLYIKNAKDLPNSIKIAASYKTVVVFDYLRDLTDPTKKIEQQLLQLGFKEVGVLDYPNIGFVRIFAIPLNVIGSK